MKLEQMKQSDYAVKFGPPQVRGRISEDRMEVWKKASSLPMVEYLVINPEKGEKAHSLAVGLKATFKKLAERLNVNFTLKVVVNGAENHVVIWKEAKR